MLHTYIWHILGEVLYTVVVMKTALDYLADNLFDPSPTGYLLSPAFVQHSTLQLLCCYSFALSARHQLSWVVRASRDAAC